MQKTCDYGCGNIAIKKFKNGNYCCSNFLSQCPAQRKKNSEGNKKVDRSNQWKGVESPLKGRIPWNKGLTKENNSSLLKASKTMKAKYESGELKPTFQNKTHTKEAKEKIRKAINERYANGWESVCGRAPKLDYESPVAGKIKVDGSWEFKVAKYLDSINVKWRRNKKRFKYFNSIKNRDATYCPDFYIEDWKTYLEVKGYETDLDRCKWSQFKEPLLIWKKDKLKELNILN